MQLCKRRRSSLGVGTVRVVTESRGRAPAGVGAGLEGVGVLGVAWTSSRSCRRSLVAKVPMTNMEGGGGASPAPSPTPQDQPTDLRMSRAPEKPHQHLTRPVPLKQSSPPPLTALPLGLQQLVRAPSSFMIGDILRQKAQEVAPPHHHHDDEGDDEDDDENGSQHVLSRQGERPLVFVFVSRVRRR